MNRKYFLIGAVALALALAGFFAVRTYASTGCFLDTNGLPTETFICWMKDNNITSGCGGGNYCPGAYVTRSQMAVFMNKQADISPSRGEMAFTFGPSEWTHGILESDVSVLPGATLLVSRTDALASNTLVFATPALPIAVYDRKTVVVAVEICYGGDTNHYLDTLTLSAGGESVQDTTNYTSGNGCVVLSFPTPPSMYPRNYVTITASVRLSSAGSFAIKSTTVFLNHTDVLVGP